ncbi:RNA polymerase recycling motor ATPase HelR [Rathayibacter sp. KR2-224]|uniref:RNA polymerase recycling motor ATPase HelR n=1 Tax=Rathayibacter sp. KR2-224 TaxID=3400913 RepID=UPI003C0E03D8
MPPNGQTHRGDGPSAFDLPSRLAAKADPALIGADEEHFAALADSIDRQVTELEVRLSAARKESGGVGQAAMDRDMEIRRLSSRLRLLRRFGLDLCLGRMVPAGGGEPVYIGRLGLTDDAADGTGRRLLVDWRAPASAPFFAATHANPMGLASRRRYRWARGRISDYWDEVFTQEGLEHNAALDDQSAFIASLGSSRSPRMRDVLSTIQADQDAIIRADSHGPLIVDGGPGTGKTVVALHRAAYLLYSEPRISSGGGGVLFIGPHQAYLDYVHDVLPSLGEESVQICTLRDLVPEGADADDERDVRVGRLKASARLVDAVEAAVRYYERAPQTEFTIETPWGEVELGATEWADAFDSAEPTATHNEAREQVWEALLEILIDQIDHDEAPPHQVRRYLMREDDLTETFAKSWPLLDPAGVVGDLLSVPAYLRLCAPWLDDEAVRMLQRTDARAWTVSDLPLLDAARQRIGDPGAARRATERAAALAAEREQRERITEDLIAADDSEMLLMRMLRGQDLKNALVDESMLPAADPDALAGPFAHVIVDEAQELSDAEWQMVLRRCPSRSLTIVGDRAQARHGFTESWHDRLSRVGLGTAALASLTVNYRTPQEVMDAAEPVIRAAIPDANVPVSVRTSGHPVVYGPTSSLRATVDTWEAEHAEGLACVIGDPSFEGSARIRSLSPEHVKGLEFDLVVLVDPERFGSGAGGAGIEGAVDRYVAMTRATQQLVILTAG